MRVTPSKLSLQRVAWGATAALLFGPSALIAWRCYRSASAAAFHPPKAPLRRPDGFAKLRDVSLGAGLRGWYADSRDGAAIIVTHGTAADRSMLVPEARALNQAGLGVLLFDWPGHGESAGEVHWAAAERLALRSALEFVTAQPDVDPSRIGLFAFSMGAYVAAQVAPDEPRFRALALAGAPTTINEVARWQYGKWGPIGYVPARLAFERGGLQPDFDLRRAVRRIAPRPLLIATGAHDTIVPVRMTSQLYDAASSPKEFYLSPRAGHGHYVENDPDFAGVLASYFTRHLGAAAR